MSDGEKIKKDPEVYPGEFEAIRVKVNLFDALLEHVPEQIYFKDKESRFVMASKSVVRQFGVRDINELIGKTDFDYFTDEHARPAFEDEQGIIKTGKPILSKVEKETHPDGKVTWVSTTKIPRYDEKGNIIGILGISRDITEKKEKEEKIKAQSAELVELSIPVIDVWEGVLAVPVLGVLDSERASRLSEALLTQIIERNATTAIVDISGISSVDSAVADMLIRTAKAVKLVGAEAVLTGVSVEIAQTIADLGVDMEGLKTMSTLKDGLKYVFQKEKKAKSASEL